MLWPLSFSTLRTCVGGFSTLTPHSNELFGARRMYCYNRVKIRFCRTHFYRNGKALDHLIYRKSDAV
jgi:hypothetical protein